MGALGLAADLDRRLHVPAAVFWVVAIGLLALAQYRAFRDMRQQPDDRNGALIDARNELEKLKAIAEPDLHFVGLDVHFGDMGEPGWVPVNPHIAHEYAFYWGRSIGATCISARH